MSLTLGEGNLKTCSRIIFTQCPSKRLRRMSSSSKFMELSSFSPAYITDQKLKMNRFEAGLNPGISEKMSV